MNARKDPGKYSKYSLMLVIFLVLMVVFSAMRNSFPTAEKIYTYSQFMTMVESKKIKKVIIANTQSRIRGETSDNVRFMVEIPTNDPDLIKTLRANRIDFSVENPGVKENLTSYLTIIIVPLLMIVGIWFLMFRQAQMGGGQVMSFGKNRARALTDNGPKHTFDDVAGVDEAIEELREIVEFLKDPKRFQTMGAKIPKGVLLVGPPGTGKTLLARAIAGEAGVPFFHMSGSDFVEMFVGVGASRVRDLFEQARKSAPCLVFVDEIDAVGRQRGAGLGGGHDEREQTLNQLLVEMDGFDPNAGVILIAATNRPDVLDPALLRPGRFDRQVVVDRPDQKGRKAILEVHGRGKPLSADVDMDIIARRTPGFTGADLANALNESALLAARRHASEITMEHVEDAIERTMAGPERKSRIMSDRERKIIAYHEAGHALIARMLDGTDPVHKISILPRGMALGYTLQLPTEDKYITGRGELINDITVLLGGRAAEELIFNEFTTGAANDIERASRISRRMVCEFGMNEEVGPVTFGKNHEMVFLGRDIGRERDYSEEVASQIDREVRRTVEDAYDKALGILTEHKDRLILVADRLMEVEHLEGLLLESLLDGKDLTDDEVRELSAERRVRDAAQEAERRRKHDEYILNEQKATVAAISDDASQERDGQRLISRFYKLLQDNFREQFLPAISESEQGDRYRQIEIDFENRRFEEGIRKLKTLIKETHDQLVLTGLRIRLSLSYFEMGNADKVADELMSALLSGSNHIEKNVEHLLIAAIGYFRIVSDELKRNSLTLSRLLANSARLRQVDSRYEEWEKRAGYSLNTLFPST